MAAPTVYRFEWFDTPGKAGLSLLTGDTPCTVREFALLHTFEAYIREVKAQGVTVYWQTPNRATACGRHVLAGMCA